LLKNPTLPNDYFVDSFIGGLKPSIKSFVRAFHTKTLPEAVEYARSQEETLEAIKRNQVLPRTIPANSHKGLLPLPRGYQGPRVNGPSQTTQLKPKTLTSAERAEKLAKGLCFFCDQHYEKDHRSNIKKTQLFLIEIPGMEDEEEEVEPGEVEEDTQTDCDFYLDNPQISVHALSGNKCFQTMRVTGQYERFSLHILIDSGSTHNFLDIAMAKKIGCKIESIQSQTIAVADGNQLQCQYVSKGFEWKLHNAHFRGDMLLIPLGSCDMVLGV